MKTKKIILIILCLILILVVGSIGYNYYSKKQIHNETLNWENYTDSINGVQLKYPENFSGSTWRAENWPPSVSVSIKKPNSVDDCSLVDISSDQKIAPENIKINNVDFTLYKGVGVGAGQLYNSYCYSTSGVNKYGTVYYQIYFLIHSANGCGNGNCGPYCGTEKEQACKTFDIQKEVEQPMRQIISTFKLTK